KETSRQSIFKKISFEKRIWLQLSALVYLTFLISALMVSPTTAYFTQSESVEGKIVAADEFDEEDQDEQNDEDQMKKEQEKDEKDSGKNEEDNTEEQSEQNEQQGDRKSTRL